MTKIGIGVGVALTLVLVAGCAGMTPGPADSYHEDMNDDVMKGPGFFSGEKGAWIWTDETKGQKETEAAPYVGKAGEATPAPLEDQLKRIDRKLKELEHQQQELERLKQEVRDSLESSFKHNSNTLLQWVA